MKEIIDYLGGINRLVALIGINTIVNLSSDGNPGVKFRFKGCTKSNTVIIKLNWEDLYDVEFWKITKLKFRKISEHTDLFADMLTPVFETETGLFLSL